jgi:RNA recognition motif. (a.k.a. RRM, RBD, or RNP domain)
MVAARHHPCTRGNARAAPGRTTEATAEATEDVAEAAAAAGLWITVRVAWDAMLMCICSSGSINPGNNLHVSNLSSRTQESDLEEVFSKFGRVRVSRPRKALEESPSLTGLTRLDSKNLDHERPSHG